MLEKPAPELASEDEFCPAEPDVSHLITEDDTPLDNIFSERQQKLFGDVLHTSYEPGVPFICLANVGLFPLVENTTLVPDCMLSLDVEFPEDIWEKGSRSYMVWRYGKLPELVIEIVSNKEGGEDTTKFETYERIRIAYYAIFDPDQHLGKRKLRVYELRGSRYVEVLDPFAPLEQLGLSFVFWDGEYQKCRNQWLRWKDLSGKLLPTGAELAEAATAKASEAEAKASEAEAKASEAETKASEAEAKANDAESRAAKLAAKLREMGLDPDSL